MCTLFRRNHLLIWHSEEHKKNKITNLREVELSKMSRFLSWKMIDSDITSILFWCKLNFKAFCFARAFGYLLTKTYYLNHHSVDSSPIHFITSAFFCFVKYVLQLSPILSNERLILRESERYFKHALVMFTERFFIKPISC